MGSGMDDVGSATEAMARSSLSDSPSATSSSTVNRSSISSSATLTSNTAQPLDALPPMSMVEEPPRRPVSRRFSFREMLASAIRPASSSGFGRSPFAGRIREAAYWADGDLSATEAELRILQLKYDALMANKAAPPRSTNELFKSACSTDILFLIDTTYSMVPWIEAAKNQVKGIMEDLKLAFYEEAEVRMAVVSYKDHGDQNMIQFQDFTTDTDQVRTFLDSLHAKGGDDLPENVLGGLKQALNATWKHKTRCIIHIADAPPHGRTLHDMTAKDRYLEPGSEPHHLTHEPLLKQTINLGINYAFLRINNTTDKMASVWLKAYANMCGGTGGKLHPSNKFYTPSPPQNSSMRATRTSLQFEEAELGTAYSELQHLVVKTVTTSASRTATGMSSGSDSQTAKGRPTKKKGFQLGSIMEDEDAGTGGDAPLDSTPPVWNRPSWFNETLRVEAFTTDVLPHGTVSLDDMMESDDNIRLTTTDLKILKRSRPFAQGEMRLASYARTAASTNHLVVKSFKKGAKDLVHFAEEMRIQALCKAFAIEFSGLVEEHHSLDFIVVSCLRPKSGNSTSSKECMSLEPFMEGRYCKYNSNGGWVNDNPGHPYESINEAAQAFSHFTYERSKGHFLVADLQGVGRMLTDPAVHASDPERFKLADTNLGETGIKFFFTTHKCNDICRSLKLQSTSSMLLTRKFEFREDWPSSRTLDDRPVCCSNKLCSRIVRAKTAMKSNEYPGYIWCNVCWPQLNSSKLRIPCDVGGPQGSSSTMGASALPHRQHRFEVSGFFYESQGQIIPRRCPQHRS